MDQRELAPDLLSAFKTGMPRAFAYFFHLYYSSLCDYAIRLTGDQQEGEDIVRESYVKLWRRHMDFDTHQAIRAFLYVATRNASLNYRRRLRVKKNSREEWVYLSAAEEEGGLLNRIIHTEMMQTIYHQAELLPEKRKEVFKLAYLEGLKNDEIASRMRISVHTVKEHKGKALHTLRIRLLPKMTRWMV